MKKLLTFFTILSFYESVYVVRRFVGFGVKVNKDDHEQVHTKEDNEMYLGISEQAKRGCIFLQNELNRLEDLYEDNGGFDYVFIGISQGGLVARLIFIECSGVKNKVKRIITQGTPNLGIDKISVFYSQSYNDDPNAQAFTGQQQQILNGIEPQLVQHQLKKGQKVAQAIVNFGAQVALKIKTQPKDSPREYLIKGTNGSELIDKLNGQHLTLQQQADFQERCKNLELYLTLGFAQENFISPPESVLFGSRMRKIGEIDTQQILQDRQAYKQFYEDLTNNYKQEELQDCNELQEQEQKDCLEQLDKDIEQNKKYMEEVMKKEWNNDRYVVDNYNPYSYKYLYLKMKKSNYIKLLSSTSELNATQKQYIQKQISNQPIVFADLLSVMLAKNTLVQCAVNGKHLQFPFYILKNQQTENYSTLEEIFEELNFIDINSERYQEILKIFNCTTRASIVTDNMLI